MSFPKPQAIELPSTVKAGAVAEELNGVTTKPLHMRDIEMVRLIGQYLCDKGYNNAYKQLAKDSGIVLEPQPATDLRAAILSGDWNATEKAVEELAPTIDNPSNLAHIRFLLLEQQFLEFLEVDEVVSALSLLRHRITPLKPDQKRLQNLAQCLMCRTTEELRAQAGGWSGTNGGSRAALVDCIQRFMPAQTMLPPGRLETLVTEAVRSQLTSCTFHTQPICWPDALESMSLLQPHACSIQDFPVFTVQKIEHRESELYFCVFSPDGNYLATGGKDANVDVWKVDPESHTIHSPRTFYTIEASISHICWSPDSKKLAVCCGLRPEPIMVFDVTTRRQVCQKLEKTEDVYITAAFFADSRKLAFGGLKGGCFYIIDTEDDGKMLFTHEYCRVQCMVAIIPPPAPTAAMVAATLAAGLTPEAAMEMDPNTSLRSPSTAAAVALEQLLAPVDQLLIVDHMYRIRIFRFGYTTSGSGSDSGVVAAASAGRGNVLPQEADMWSANRGGSVAPIIVALQNALFSSRVGSRGVPAGVPLTPLPPPPPPPPAGTPGGVNVFPMRQTTSDSNFGVLGIGRQQTQPASTPGSVIGLAGDPRNLGSLAQQVVVQIQPSLTSPGFALQAINRDGSTSSASSLVGPGPVGTGYTVESVPLSSFPASLAAATVMTSALPSIMQNYYWRSGSISTIPIPRGNASGGGSGSTSAGGNTSRTGTAAATTMASGLQEGDSDTAEVSTNTEAAMGTTQTASASNSASASVSQGQVYSLLHQATLIKEMHPVQSIVLSPSCKRLLVGLNAKGIILWDLESHGIIQRFYGHHQVQQKLYYTFCGFNEDFIACGSENGFVHIWRVGSPQGSRPIHSSMAASSNETSVTGVHWNPAIPTMMASVNDDGEIRIWGSAKYASGCT
ncbi:WD repeat-containing protein 26 [Echinococcus granulosus]|uniref:WD repeat-containing protein 26 n=1 Tax=Echinococcus granulosus TaxID=6210 RepID=U6JCB7_ECHGR|nr:WD repeat-containing protein 26 [Echinococcus granulosus]EUB60349.1 WD repeat-containing protein 26 [Echinococcus granulosus]KAH9280684.1 WD repeat-containing protein 26 [Echinococcus granulosus]CDS19350.1 WD repeat containing protein 26 [Echinococcus granulosus]